jgi:hypothetical protein
MVAAGPAGGLEPVLALWLRNQNLYAGVASGNNASNFQPWLRLAETDVSQFYSAMTVLPPTLRSTSLAGDINLVGNLNLFPSPTGTLELAAAGSIAGLQPAGRALTPTAVQNPPAPATVWTSARINLSDAPPASLPGVLSPVAYQSLATVGRNLQASRSSSVSALVGLDAAFDETGSYSGVSGSAQVQRALHDPSVLHRNDDQPLRAFAMDGAISGLTLFSAKQSRLLAASDITDVALYIQNSRPGEPTASPAATTSTRLSRSRWSTVRSSMPWPGTSRFPVRACCRFWPAATSTWAPEPTAPMAPVSASPASEPCAIPSSPKTAPDWPC